MKPAARWALPFTLRLVFTYNKHLHGVRAVRITLSHLI